MRLALDISPCPNDTFSFDALVNGRIDTRGYTFDVRFADIEELNARVIDGGSDTAKILNISKISYAILPLVHDRWALLDSGSALGHGNGPVLVARAGFDIDRFRAEGAAVRGAGASAGLSVAVPGLHTTANLLMQRMFPRVIDRRPLLFSEIAAAVARGDFDAGVLIHEGRFTFRKHGLELVADLGAEWNKFTSATAQPLDNKANSRQKTIAVQGLPQVLDDILTPPAKSLAHSDIAVMQGLPLPLGAIVASRTLPPAVRRDVEELIRASIEYAIAHPAASRDFVKAHARELDDRTIDSHIALFVNDNSLTLSDLARRAIAFLTGVEV